MRCVCAEYAGCRSLVKGLQHKEALPNTHPQSFFDMLCTPLAFGVYPNVFILSRLTGDFFKNKKYYISDLFFFFLIFKNNQTNKMITKIK